MTANDEKNTIKFRDYIDVSVIHMVIEIELHTIWAILSQNFVWRINKRNEK